jgi:radical SAM family uncharacterized protein/radical SAM-linked protein
MTRPRQHDPESYRERLEALLPRVERPVRYLGGEWNSVVKDHASVELTVALAFPDLYEIGMSHLGYRILYAQLNEREDTAAERCFAPWPDLEALLRQEGLPLASLESDTPLANFDLVGFSLQYELNYTNVLLMLDLGGVPLRSEERGEEHPFVIAGGSAVFNPEPVAEFVDFFFIGDAEELLPEFLDRCRELKRKGAPRARRLRELARIQGIYAPALYRTEPEPSTGLLLARPGEGEEVPERVTRRIVLDLDRYPFPERVVVPFGEIVHDRVSWELMRGCPVGCRFCQAGYIYRPTRERDPRAVLEGIGRSLEATGYDGFSLTSLNTGEYGDVEALLTRLMDTYEDESTSVSLSSLHASTLTATLAEQIKRVRKSGFTIAPEAGSQRMREVINKNLSEEQILGATGHAFDAGWQLIKLYFMIGLPLEREEDVGAIAELAVRVLEQGREKAGKRVRVTLSASNFIPKPFTPFQWFPMERVESFRQKQSRLRSLLPRGVSFKFHRFESSWLEGVFSRGDRRLGAALEAAYRRGCRFDGWTEHLDLGAWREAFGETGIDPDEYAYREIPLEAELPWQVLDSQINERWLRREYKRSLEAATLSICGPTDCHGCAPFARDCVKGLIAETTGRTLPTLQAAPGAGAPPPDGSAAGVGSAGPGEGEEAETPPPPPPVYRYRARFEKTGRLRFLGHLDLMRLLVRAFRRAGVRLVHSQGFHPKPRMAFGPALGLGIESRAEHLDFESRDYLEPASFLRAVNEGLPEGVRFRELGPIGPRTPGLQESIRLTRYAAGRGRLEAEEARRRVESFRARERHSVRRERKGKIQELDIVPLIEEIGLSNGEVRFALRSAEGPGVRPREVLEAVFGAEEAEGMSLRREEMLVEHRGRLLSPLVAGRATGRHGHRDHP